MPAPMKVTLANEYETRDSVDALQYGQELRSKSPKEMNW